MDSLSYCHCCFLKKWMWFPICCHCPFSKGSGCCFSRVITAHLISSGCISGCFACSLWKSNGCSLPCAATAYLVSSGWISINVVLQFSKAVDMAFHMLLLPSLKNQWICFSMCCHCTLSKEWMIFHIVPLLCIKQCMRFSACCHYSFLTISGLNFPWAVTTISLNWIGFSTCCQCFH